MASPLYTMIITLLENESKLRFCKNLNSAKPGLIDEWMPPPPTETARIHRKQA